MDKPDYRPLVMLSEYHLAYRLRNAELWITRQNQLHANIPRLEE